MSEEGKGTLRKGAREVKRLSFPRLCALAAWREIVYSFHRFYRDGLRPFARGAG